MRCPDCGDEYEPGVEACADCGVPLVDDGADVTAAGEADTPGAYAPLGRFHPAVAEQVAALLDRRGIGHVRTPVPDGVQVDIERAWRDDLRAELTVSWGEVVRALPEEVAAEVLAGGGGAAPGWYDSPRGGHVDRAGRLVVDDGEEDDARVVGPALLTVGAILAVVGWYVFDVPAVAVAGLGLAVTGLFLPR